jgi:UDPglucose 6-dehydrogenase
LHLPLRSPIIITDLRTAEMIKYASNAFLATKISFVNEIADICEVLGADVKEVAVGMGYDKRIGIAMLDAGLGWGGSCFPKDIKALTYMAEEKGLNPQVLKTVTRINYDRRRMVVKNVGKMLGGLKNLNIGLLGLAFKPNTDDMREAPSIDIAQGFITAGAVVRAYDPVAMENAHEYLPFVEMAADPYALAKDCDALVVLTEWNEFKNIDLQRIRESMRTPVIFDGRNIFEPKEMRELGFTYQGVGRGFDQP